jgi:hypothetical protein
MQKKTCETCGKIWIIEKFDAHLCVPLPKKPRKTRAAAAATPPADPKAGTGSAADGPPLVAFRRK